ncbi:hypothetical protein M2155_002800 [Streptomyces sp. SAI-119]|nr:hypothetical protein [Streptomyces sp. SAI-119]
MAGHEFFEPADRKRPVADPTAAEPLAAEEPRHSCDPAFKHGVVVGFDGSTSSERALAYAIGMAHRSGSGLIIVHVANRLPTTVWAGCEPPVFVDVPDHRTEVLGLELACADYLAEVPWILVERGGDICHELEEGRAGVRGGRDRRRLHPRHRRAHLRLRRGAARQAGEAARHRHPVTPLPCRRNERTYPRVEVFVPL